MQPNEMRNGPNGCFSLMITLSLVGVSMLSIARPAGAKTADVCRRHGISEATFYAWKAKFGGMAVSEAKRLKALEDENVRLKKLLAEAMLDNAVLKDLATKKW